MCANGEARWWPWLRGRGGQWTRPKKGMDAGIWRDLPHIYNIWGAHERLEKG